MHLLGQVYTLFISLLLVFGVPCRTIVIKMWLNQGIDERQYFSSHEFVS